MKLRNFKYSNKNNNNTNKYNKYKEIIGDFIDNIYVFI